jgi:hypothetical protein
MHSVSTYLYVRFQVLTAASMIFRIVFWDVLPCKIIVDRRFRGAYCSEVRTASIIIPDNGGSMHLWNVGRQLFYTAVHPRRQFWTLICSLFNDDLSVTQDYFTSNEKVLREWWVGKVLEGNGRGLILRHYYDIRLEGLRKATKKPESG